MEGVYSGLCQCMSEEVRPPSEHSLYLRRKGAIYYAVDDVSPFQEMMDRVDSWVSDWLHNNLDCALLFRTL